MKESFKVFILFEFIYTANWLTAHFRCDMLREGQNFYRVCFMIDRQMFLHFTFSILRLRVFQRYNAGFSEFVE